MVIRDTGWVPPPGVYFFAMLVTLGGSHAMHRLHCRARLAHAVRAGRHLELRQPGSWLPHVRVGVTRSTSMHNARARPYRSRLYQVSPAHHPHVITSISTRYTADVHRLPMWALQARNQAGSWLTRARARVRRDRHTSVRRYRPAIAFSSAADNPYIRVAQARALKAYAFKVADRTW